MPLPEIQIFGGGAHAQGRIDLQDIMALPVGAPDWSTALDWCARMYRSRRCKMLSDSGSCAESPTKAVSGRTLPATKRCWS